MQIIPTDNTDIALIQEPYIYQSRTAGITQGYRTYTYGAGKRRAAIIISKNKIGALLLTQLSDNDTVLLEIRKGTTTFYAASIYMDFKDSIENSIKTIQKILEFTKGTKLIIAMDSNARSTTWYDMTTNHRGKLLEEFLASNQLHIINEESTRTSFHSSRGRSNIDITLTNNQMLADINNWHILEEESASDHSIIKFNIKFSNTDTKINIAYDPRYITKEQQQTEFHEKLYHIITKTFQIKTQEGREVDIDEELNRLLKGHTDIRKLTETLD